VIHHQSWGLSAGLFMGPEVVRDESARIVEWIFLTTRENVKLLQGSFA
jgi:hypothetical protein